jgi:hypothetical protein
MLSKSSKDDHKGERPCVSRFRPAESLNNKNSNVQDIIAHVWSVDANSSDVKRGSRQTKMSNEQNEYEQTEDEQQEKEQLSPEKLEKQLLEKKKQREEEVIEFYQVR